MNLDHFDSWLDMNGPVAVVVQEDMEPVQGKEAVFFPPTFAPPEGSQEAPSYVVDDTSQGKVAVVDTVGSQANRMEPLFKESPYSELVPKATVEIGERKVDLLDVGHRAADAVVRFSGKWVELKSAFLAIRNNGDAVPLAKLAPTSLVFGVWDSRDTQVKLPRLVGSTIRAYGVEKLTRSAQFFSATEKEDTEGLGTQKFLSAVGLDDAPAGRTNGGVISRLGIQRQAVLNLVALRALGGKDGDQTRKLQRYILGLSLIALVSPSQRFLREGCLLVPPEGQYPTIKLVERTGKRADLQLPEEGVLEFARAAANDFGVGDGWIAKFSRDSVSAAAKSDEKKKEEKKGKK